MDRYADRWVLSTVSSGITCASMLPSSWVENFKFVMISALEPQGCDAARWKPPKCASAYGHVDDHGLRVLGLGAVCWRRLGRFLPAWGSENREGNELSASSELRKRFVCVARQGASNRTASAMEMQEPQNWTRPLA